MIRNNSQYGLGSNTAKSTASRANGAARHTLRSFSRSLLHARALVRLARSRPSLALGLVVAAASATTTAATAGAVLSHHTELRSTVLPLAPAPAPPAPPDEQVAAKSRLAARLEKINPLRGLASWYGDVWNGRKTASGETFDETKLTAAHKTLPLGTIVRVTNLNSMRSVVVKINDRGTLAPHRIIDLSSAAAKQLGMIDDGLARVKLEILGKV